MLKPIARTYIAIVIFVIFAVTLASTKDATKFCFSCKTRRNHRDLYADPSDCHFYYQCFYQNEKTAYGYRRQCPKKQFWSDRILSCLPESSNINCQDPCYLSSFNSSLECYGVVESCSSYFVCSNGASYRMCCPAGTAFRQSICSCELNPSCLDDACSNEAEVEGSASTMAPEVIDQESGVCRDNFGNYLRIDQTSPSQFFIYQYDQNLNHENLAFEAESRIAAKCPERTLFDVTTCSCSIIVDATLDPPLSHCLLELPFDEDLDDRSGQGFIGFRVGKQNSTTGVQRSIFRSGTGSLKLDGNGHIEYPGLKSISFIGEASWCFFYRCPDGGCQKDGAILSNGDCEPNNEFSIQVIQRASGTIEAIVSLNPGNVFANLSAVSSPVGSFAHVCVIFLNSTVSLYLNNDLADSKQVKTGSTIQTGHCPFVIGHDLSVGYFSGFVDNVVVCQKAFTVSSMAMRFQGFSRDDWGPVLRTYRGDDKQTWPTPRAPTRPSNTTPVTTTRTTTRLSTSSGATTTSRTTSRTTTRTTTTTKTTTTLPPGTFCAYVAWRGVGWLPNPVYFTNATAPIDRIINGEPVEQGESPWTVRLFSAIDGNIDKGHICTGTLIDSQWVLTSASCIYRGDDWLILEAASVIRVELGSSNIKSPQKGVELRDYMMALRHCNFHYGVNDQKTVHAYNMALIRLDEPVAPTAVIKAAKLPLPKFCERTSNSLSSRTIDFCNEISVSGWGSTNVMDPVWSFTQQLLKTSSLYMTTREECEDTYGIGLANIQFCAANSDIPSSICGADMGAGALCTRTICEDANCRLNMPFIVGVVTWQNHGCNSAYPSGFTRTCSVLPWIRAAMSHFANVPPPSTSTVRPTPATSFCAYTIKPGENWMTQSISYRAATASERIVNGIPVTSQAALPWMAHVRIIDGSMQYFSAGVLINSQWILTSAITLTTVMKATSKLEITLGTTLPFGNPQHGSQTRAFYLAVRHCQQSQQTGKVQQPYNIAMVKLSEPVTFSEFVQPIATAFDVGACQANVGPWDDWIDGCKRILHAGWGGTDQLSIYSPSLRKAESRVVNRQLCENEYLCELFDQFCSVDNANLSTSCSNDDGGPAVCTELYDNSCTANGNCPKLPYLVGLVNWHHDQCEPGQPTAFSRICFVADWIKATLKHFA